MRIYLDVLYLILYAGLSSLVSFKITILLLMFCDFPVSVFIFIFLLILSNFFLYNYRTDKQEKADN